MSTVSAVASTGKRVLSDVADKNVTFMAAGIAYNAFVSLAPLLVLGLFVVSTVSTGLEARVVQIAETMLPGPIAGVVTSILTSDTTATGASVVGLVVLLWGTLKVFRGLDTAFSEIYETTDANSFVDQLVDGVVVLVALLTAIVATIAASAAFATLSDAVPFVGVLAPLVLVAGLVLALLPMYYRFPDADHDLLDVLPGAIFGAVGWAAFQGLFQLYLTFKSGGAGGFFGGVIVVVTWLYVSGLVLLVGAVINAVVGGHSTGRTSGVGRNAGVTLRTDASSGVDADGRETGRVVCKGDLDRRELAAYLETLREEVAEDGSGIVEGESGRDGRASVDARWRSPVGDVTVEERVERVERTRGPGERDGDRPEAGDRDGEEAWTVTLRWRSPPADSTE